jgi:MFS family permease
VGGLVRRLTVLVSALLFVEAIFFSVLTPLLPSLRLEFAVSTFELGLLVAAFGLGAIIAAVPSAIIAARVGVKPTAVAGVLILGAMSVLFGVSRDYDVLLAARFVEGIGSGACLTGAIAWLIDAAPEARRGEVIGVAFGAGAAGSIMGPLFGGIAVAAGRPSTFVGIAVVALLLGLIATWFPSSTSPEAERLLLRVAMTSKRIWTGVWLICLPAIVLGAVDVLSPLQLHRLGMGSGGIAIIFGVAAAIGVLLRPLAGRWSDRHGRLPPIRLGLFCCIPLLLVIPLIESRWGVATLLIVALVMIGVFWAPVMAFVADACAAVGVGQLVAVLILNIGWAPGTILGSVLGGGITQAAGEITAYALLSGVLLVTLLALWSYQDGGQSSSAPPVALPASQGVPAQHG